LFAECAESGFQLVEPGSVSEIEQPIYLGHVAVQPAGRFGFVHPGDSHCDVGPAWLPSRAPEELWYRFAILSGRVARAHFGPDFRIPLVARGFEIILGLHVDPIVWRRVEVASQTQGGLSGDSTLAGDDSGNSVVE